MTRSRPLIAGLAAKALVALVVASAYSATAAAPAAEANLTYKDCYTFNGKRYCRRFVFRPTTYESVQDGTPVKRLDPINILFHGGDSSRDFTEPCRNDRARSIGCVKSHMFAHWTDRGRMDNRFCSPPNQYMSFRRHSGGGYANDKGDMSLTTSRTCKRQFHIRGWDDIEHGHGHSSHQWAVGAIHHEDRKAHCVHKDVCDGTTHRIDQDWEWAENVAMQEMKAHCTHPDYFPLPGSGPGKWRGRYTNGRISRISFQHRDIGCSGT